MSSSTTNTSLISRSGSNVGGIDENVGVVGDPGIGKPSSAVADAWLLSPIDNCGNSVWCTFGSTGVDETISNWDGGSSEDIGVGAGASDSTTTAAVGDEETIIAEVTVAEVVVVTVVVGVVFTVMASVWTTKASASEDVIGDDSVVTGPITELFSSSLVVAVGFFFMLVFMLDSFSVMMPIDW